MYQQHDKLLSQKHPDLSQEVLQLVTAGYDTALPRTRSGAALAVKACAHFLDGRMLMTALHFLLEHGLADVAHVQDQKATVSEQMMQAGEPALCSMQMTAKCCKLLQMTAKYCTLPCLAGQ